MATIKTCTRCKGKGLVPSRVAHMGMPGTCYGCDGSGKQVVFTMEERVARFVKRCEDWMAELEGTAANLKAQKADLSPKRKHRHSWIDEEIASLRKTWIAANLVWKKARATGKVTNKQQPKTMPSRYAPKGA